MARVRLEDYEVEEDLLPQVCMKCGAEAATTKRKTFSWYPPWIIAIIIVAPLPGLIVAMVLTKRMTVRVPICDQHKNHWTWRHWFAGLTVLGLGAMGVAGLIVLLQFDRRMPSRNLASWACIGTGVALVVWVVVIAVVYNTAIRPTEITNRDITLTDVSPDFVAALEDELDQEELAEQQRRARRRVSYSEADEGYFERRDRYS